jgi:hypothetical protein
MGGIVLGILMASGESELHAIISPDKETTALVIADDCGATCGCTTRIDVKTSSDYKKEVWRGIDVCDAQIEWISSTEFYILADNGQKIYIDISTLEFSP